MLLTSLETVPGKTIVKHPGLVQGSSVRAKHVGRDKDRGQYRLGRGPCLRLSTDSKLKMMTAGPQRISFSADDSQLPINA